MQSKILFAIMLKWYLIMLVFYAEVKKKEINQDLEGIPTVKAAKDGQMRCIQILKKIIWRCKNIMVKIEMIS